jgi:hypothetical protein
VGTAIPAGRRRHSSLARVPGGPAGCLAAAAASHLDNVNPAGRQGASHEFNLLASRRRAASDPIRPVSPNSPTPTIKFKSARRPGFAFTSPPPLRRLEPAASKAKQSAGPAARRTGTNPVGWLAAPVSRGFLDRHTHLVCRVRETRIILFYLQTNPAGRARTHICNRKTGGRPSATREPHATANAPPPADC